MHSQTHFFFVVANIKASERSHTCSYTYKGVNLNAEISNAQEIKANYSIFKALMALYILSDASSLQV